MVPPHRHQPHRVIGQQICTSRVIYQDTYLAPLEPHRHRHPLQPVRTGQNGQTRTPLPSTQPLVPHTRTTDTDANLPAPEAENSLCPPLHILLPQTGTIREGTHCHLSVRTADHLQRDTGLYHPHRTPQDPSGPPHHVPCRIGVPAHVPMPPPKAITSGPNLFLGRLKRIGPQPHHRRSHAVTDLRHGAIPHEPLHRPHHLPGLPPRGTRSNGRRDYQTSDHATRQSPPYHQNRVRC